MVTFEKARVNVWNIGGFAFLLVTTAFGWGFSYSRMGDAIASAKNNNELLASEIKDIRLQLPTYNAMQYQINRMGEQIAENKAADAVTSSRIDKMSETFNGKLDVISAQTNKIAIAVEVMNAKNEGNK